MQIYLQFENAMYLYYDTLCNKIWLNTDHLFANSNSLLHLLNRTWQLWTQYVMATYCLSCSQPLRQWQLCILTTRFHVLTSSTNLTAFTSSQQRLLLFLRCVRITWHNRAVICCCSTGSRTAAWLTHVTSWGSYWLLSWCIRIFCVGLTPVRWVGVLVFWWNWLSQVSIICILTGGGCFMRSKTWDKQPYFVYHNTFVTLSVPCISLIWHKFIDQQLHIYVTCHYN